MSEAVAELFGLLGIKTDARSVELAHQALTKLAADTDKATNTAKLSAALTHVHGDAAKAAGLIGLTYDAAGAKAARATSRAERWGKAMIAVNQTLEVGLKLYRGVQAGIQMVVGAVQGVADQASTAVDVGQRLGMSAAAVQELGYAASQSSSDVEGMTLAMTGLSNKLDEAKKGGKNANKALRDVGLDKGAAGRPLDETLGKIADQFATMPDGAKKSALAVDLFGKAGSKMIPLLNGGSAGLAALRKEAVDTGYVIDSKAAAAMEGFGDSTDKLKAQVTGLRNQAIVAILPMLQKMVAGMQGWIQANRGILIEVLTTALRTFLGVLKVVGSAVEGVIAVVGFLADNWEFVIGAVVGLTVAMWPLIAAWIAEAAAATAAAVATAAAWLIAAGPAILVVAGIMLVVGAFIRFRKQAAGVLKAIGGFFKDLWGGISSGAAWVWNTLSAMGSAIGDFFGGIAATIRSVFESVVNWFIDRINNVIWVVNKTISALNHLPGVNIGKVGTIDHVGGDGGGSVPSRATVQVSVPMTGGGRGQVNNLSANVTINAQTGADAKEIARHAKHAAKEALADQVRGASAGLGGGRR